MIASSVVSLATLFLLLLALIPTAFVCAGHTSLSNINALQDIYNAANGSGWNWGQLPGMQWVFNSTADPCQDDWQGVQCDGCSYDLIPCNITKLSLPNYNMQGSLSPSLCNLLNLTNVTLSSNNLSSELPSCIMSDLPHLQFLCLTINHFHGSLPSQNSNDATISTNLRHLDLSTNLFSGTVPSLFGLLSQLTSLTLSSNLLSGPFPTFIGANMTSLLSLGLNVNSFTGTVPASYFLSVPSLVDLRIGGNPLQGTIATTICNISNLVHLHMNGSEFTGLVPPCLFTGKLMHLYIDNNKFSGGLPEVMTAPLVAVFAQYNRLNGTLPNALGCLQHLSIVVMAFNKFSGSIPTTLTALTILQVLVLNGNQLTGNIPSRLLALPYVYLVNLSCNHLNGTLPANYSNTLETLYLNSNNLTGTLPVNLAALPLLQQLDLAYNVFSGTIPRELVSNNVSTTDTGTTGSMLPPLGSRSLIMLNLDYNRFHGDLNLVFTESAVQELPMLQMLVLSSNQFTGQIPSVLLALPTIAYLSLSANCFSGYFPAITTGSPTLSYLYMDVLTSQNNCRKHSYAPLYVLLSWFGYDADRDFRINNTIKGDLPSNLFTANPLLNTFQFGGNVITSVLPATAPDNNVVESMSLSHNRLEGVIPTWIQQSTVLTVLDLSNNRLQGTIESMTCVYNDDEDGMGKHNNSLALYRNHISGQVPEKYWNVFNISVLAGNSFQCDFTKSDIPVHDNGYENVSCGSDALTTAYILNAVIIVILIMIVLVNWKWHVDYQRHLLLKIKKTVMGDVEMPVVSAHASDKLSASIDNNRIKTGTATDDDSDDRSIDSIGSSYSQTLTDSTGRSPTISVRLTELMANNKEKKDWFYFLLGMVEFVWTHNELLTRWETVCVDRTDSPTAVEIETGRSASCDARVNSTTAGTVLVRREVGGDFGSIRLFFTAISGLRRFALIIAFIAVFVFTPAYIILKSINNGTYSTQFYQYGWIVSSLYINGAKPGTVLLILWLLVAALTVVYGRHMRNAMLDIGVAVKESYRLHTSHNLWIGRLKYCWRWLQIIVNILVVGAANVYYLRLRANSSSPYDIYLAVIFIVSFNFAWQLVMVQLVIFNGYDVRLLRFMGVLLRPLVWMTVGYESDPLTTVSAKTSMRIRRKSGMLTRVKVDASVVSLATADVAGVSDSDEDNDDDDDECGRSNTSTPKKMRIHVNEMTWTQLLRYISTYRKATLRDRIRYVHSPAVPMFQFLTMVFNIIIVPWFTVLVTNPQCFAGLLSSPTTITSSVSYYLCELDTIGTMKRYELTGTNYVLGVVCDAYSDSQLQTISSTYEMPFVYGNLCMAEILSSYVPVLMLNYFITGIVMPVFHLLVMYFCANRVDCVLDILKLSRTLRLQKEERARQAKRDAFNVPSHHSSGRHITAEGMSERQNQYSAGRSNIDQANVGDSCSSSDNSTAGNDGDGDDSNSSSSSAAVRPSVASAPSTWTRFRWWVIRTAMSSSLMYWPIEIVMKHQRETYFTHKINFSGSSSLLFSTIGAVIHLLTYGLAYAPLAVLIAISVITTTAEYQYIVQGHVTTLFKHNNLEWVKTYRRKLEEDCRGLWKVFGQYLDLILIIAGCFHASYLGDTAIYSPMIWRIAGFTPIFYWCIKRLWVYFHPDSYKQVTDHVTRSITQWIRQLYHGTGSSGSTVDKKEWAAPLDSSSFGSNTNSSTTSSVSVPAAESKTAVSMAPGIETNCSASDTDTYDKNITTINPLRNADDC